MNVELAKSAGFCFGVKRAIEMIYKALYENKKICTLGNIINNKNMIDELNSKGVRVINSLDEAHSDETIVIRSHGVSQGIYDLLASKSFLDGTCPFVKKIHKIVSKQFVDPLTNKIINSDNILIVIIGNKSHPEIKGIEGNCKYKFITVADSIDLERYIKNTPLINNLYIKVVCQTTYIQENLKDCIDILDFYSLNYELFDTICNETKKRQDEAYEMSKNKDLMIVVGDKNSSNSNKLFDICNENCSTIFIESEKNLKNYNFFFYNNIGVTAGASTPLNIIANVLNKIKGKR